MGYELLVDKLKGSPVKTLEMAELIKSIESIQEDAFRVDGIIQIGSTTTVALALGGGTSATPMTTAVAGSNFLGFWTQSTATSGDSRGMYLRHYFAGAGGSGEALRAYGTVSNVTAATGGTVNGAHVSLSISGTSGKVSGAGNALRATLSLGALNVPGGTLAVIQADSDIASDATVPAGTAFIRMTNTNTGTINYALRLPTIASAGILAAHITDAFTHSIRCIDAAGTVFYIRCTNIATNRTGGA
jgi:hypothetical protein